MTNDKSTSKDASTHIADEAGKAGDTIRTEASQLAEEAKNKTQKQAEKQFEKGQDAVASQVDTLSSAVDDAASALNEQDHPLAHYTREIADSMSGLSEKISNSSMDELAHDTRRLARENPGLFMLGSIAIGVAASRFFKASADRDSREYMDNDSNDSGRYASEYGRSTSVRASYPHSAKNHHDVASSRQRSEGRGLDGNTNTGRPATATGANVQHRTGVSPSVPATDKSVNVRSVEESEEALE